MRAGVMGIWLALSSSAWAGDVFPDALGLVEFLPVADVVADGTTTVPIHFLALDGEGQGITGVQAKLSASAGLLQEWTDQGDGLYRVLWTPPKADIMSSAQITLKGKTLDKQTIKRAATIRMRPWTPGAIALSVNPTQLSVGQVDTATMNVALADKLTPTKTEDLAIRVSVGAVADMTQMGENRFTARYEAPESSGPSLAIVTLMDTRRPDRSYGAFAIPIAAKRKQLVRAPAGSDVIVKVGEREFGPLKVSKRGRVEVELLAQPGLREGTVSINEGGNWSEKPLTMEWASPRRLQWVPTPKGVPGDASRTMSVRVAVFDEQGAPDPNAAPALSADVGQVGAAEYEGDGIYVAQYTPPNSLNTQTVTLKAQLGDAKEQVDTVAFQVVPGRPSAVTIVSDPVSLSGTKDVTLCATVTGPGGVSLSHLPIDWNLTGGAQQGVPSLGEGGCAAISVKTYGAGLRAIASTGTEATGNPLHRVVLVHSGGVPADGVSSTLLTAMTLDRNGYPVAGIPVRLLVEGGDGSLPKTVTSNERGVAQVFYTSGRTPGLIRVRANAGSSSAVVGFLQGPAVLSNRKIPRSGALEEASLADQWGRTVGRIQLDP